MLCVWSRMHMNLMYKEQADTKGVVKNTAAKAAVNANWLTNGELMVGAH